MKQLISSIIILLFMGTLFISCNDELLPTEANDDALNSVNKVVVTEHYDEMVFEEVFGPTSACPVEEELQLNGKVAIFWQSKTTPSGNTINKGWTDYFYFPESPVYYQGLTTGEKWYLYKVSNPFHEVIKENGFYKLKFTSHEYYRNEITGEELRWVIQGWWVFDKNGVESYYREEAKCK